FPLPGGLASFAGPVEAPPNVFTFNAGTFGSGPTLTSFAIGTINFKVQPGGAIDDALADVTLGFYNAGVDGLFDNAGSPVAPAFLDGYVIPGPSITAWRSVLTHAGTPRSIILNGAATGNGLIGPTVEPRM